MTAATSLFPALIGLGTGLALIIAIGTQNAYVLRLGIVGRQRLIVMVVAICALSDAILIAAGVLGIGVVIERAPVVLVVIRVVGSVFLLAYGLMAARRAVHPGALVPTTESQSSIKTAALTVLSLTWLNPHVYLDTVILLGSIANQQGPGERWWWAGGAMLGSLLWFSALGFGARLLRPFFARPASWRILDAVIAVVMVTLGIRLAIGL